MAHKNKINEAMNILERKWKEIASMNYPCCLQPMWGGDPAPTDYWQTGGILIFKEFHMQGTTTEKALPCLFRVTADYISGVLLLTLNPFPTLGDGLSSILGLSHSGRTLSTLHCTGKQPGNHCN